MNYNLSPEPLISSAAYGLSIKSVQYDLKKKKSGLGLHCPVRFIQAVSAGEVLN